MNAIIFSAFWGVLMMFIGAFVKSKTAPKYIAVLGMLLLSIVNAVELSTGSPVFYINSMDMLRVDSFNLGFLQVIFGCSLIYFIMSGRDFEKIGEHVSEYFALLFFVTVGISLCATYNTLLILFIGIEIMSIPLYVLTGADKRNLKGNEASLKYLLMGSFSTGILLMGIAFIYGGNPNASFYINSILLGEGSLNVMMTVGLVLMVVALSFKSSAAPFHFWAPDVYDGAPAVITSHMASIIKVAAFYAFIRLFENAFGSVQAQWQNLIIFITVATLLVGNLTAVFQQSVKRMLAYSSVAHAGFMMLGIFALNVLAKEGIVLYAAAYSLATIGLFGILVKMKDYTVDGFNGLYKTAPLVAICATVFLLSLTGIPLTAGFQAKFFMLMAAAENGNHIWLIIVAVLFAAVSAYYYFRVIQAIYFKEPAEEIAIEKSEMTPGFRYMLILSVVLIILIGIQPDLVIRWLHL